MFGQYLKGVVWFRLWDNQPLCVVMLWGIYNNANCGEFSRLWCWRQTHDYSAIPHQAMWRYSVSARANEKTNQKHLLNLGGQKEWGSCLPAFQSLLCVNAKCQTWPLKKLWKTIWQAKKYLRKKIRYEQPVVVCHLVFCWHAKGILSTFVSLSSTKDWASHRDRHKLFCTTG